MDATPKPDYLTIPFWEVYLLTDWQCDCDPREYHRWNCTHTPIWAQTIRDLDTNPWTCVTNHYTFTRINSGDA